MQTEFECLSPCACLTRCITLQRKISTPEYKNVDEEHRIAMIKHETTQMVVRDLEKYHSALDKVRLHVPLV